MRRALVLLLVSAALQVFPAPARAVGPAVTITGRVVSVVVDGIDPATGKPTSEVLTWLQDAAGARHRLETAGGPPAHGRIVTVEGTLEGDRLVARSVGAAASPLAGPVQPQSVPADPQRTLVALVDFPDAPGWASGPADARAAVFDGPLSSDSFLRENSGGVEKLTGDPVTSVVGWRTLPGPRASYTDMLAMTDEIIALFDPEVLYTEIGRLVLIFSQPPGYASVLGHGSLGTFSLASADGQFTATIAWIYGNVDPSVISHELGHNLGFMHAASILCPVSPATDGLPESMIDPQSSCLVPAYYEEYGDPHDTMGNSGDYDHFGVRRKVVAGWVPPAQVVDASAGGTFAVDQVELPSAGTKALAIGLGTDHQGGPIRYWLEFRAGLGFDGTAGVQLRAQTRTYLPKDLFTPGKWTANHLRYTTDGWWDWSGAAPGAPFGDTHRGVKVEVLGTSGSGAAAQAQVKVSYSGVRLEPEGVLNCGNVLVGHEVVRTLTVRNLGATPVLFGALAAAGRNAPDLALRNDGCSGQVVAAGGSCTVEVACSPQAEGERFAVVRLPSDDPLRPKATLATYAAGIRSSLPVLTPASVDFGGVGLGTTGAPHRVVVSNEGNVEMPTQIGYDGEFPVTNNTCTAPVPPGGSCSFDIAYAPVYAAGTVARTLEIVTNSRLRYVRLGLVAEALMVNHRVTVLNETPALGRVYSVDPVTYLADGKIDCGLGKSACAADYPYAYGAFSIRLRTEAPEWWAYEFDSWGGDYPSYLQELGLHSTRDYDLTARFREKHVFGLWDGRLGGVCHGTLTLDNVGQQTTCPWDGTQTGVPPFGFNCRFYPAVGTQATLTAIAEPGCAATIQVGSLCTGNPCTVTVPDTSLTFAVDFFPLAPVPMKVTAPAPKSAVPAGGYATIAWESPHYVQYFTVELSLDGGKSWTTIGEDLELFDETWVRWWVPPVPDNVTKAKVRVTGSTYNGVKGMAASGLFTIEVVKLLAPNGGEVLAAGEVVPVSWRVAKTQSPVASIELYVSTAAGFTGWRKIAAPTRKVRAIDWKVPAWAAANPALPRKMKVVLKNAAGKIVGSDLSDAAFTIRP